jgi:hypothetical protein
VPRWRRRTRRVEGGRGKRRDIHGSRNWLAQVLFELQKAMGGSGSGPFQGPGA